MKISQNVTSMQKMVNQLSSGDSSEIRKQLNDVTHYTGQLAKDTSEDLKELNKFPVGDQKQLKLKREKITSDFSTVLNAFQNTQRAAATKEKELMRAIQQEDDQTIKPIRGPNQQLTSRQIFAEEENVGELLERERSIRQLESDILTVNQIFKDLASMVHEQGATIDSIEANIEDAHIQVEEGTRTLSNLETSRNRSRRRQIVLMLVLAAFVIVVILCLIYT